MRPTRRSFLAGAALAVALAALAVPVALSPRGRPWLKYAFDRATVPAPQRIPAAEVALAYPSALRGGTGQAVYVAERLGHRIWRLDDGHLIRVAGTGRLGLSPEGVPADRARIFYPEGLAVDSTGGFVFADSWNQRVRRVDADGRIWTLAGNGTEGYAGDGGPALEAQLHRPFDVALEPGGAVLIVDWGNHCVRRVESGIIETFAGRCGHPGYAGDGGPATEAHFDEPYGVAVGLHGEVYVADSRNDRVRRIAPDGTVDTIAGTGITGFSGDGGPATEARLSSPQAIKVLADGELLIDDEHNNRVRRIGRDGTIQTVAGGASHGFGGDGGAAVLALIDDPEDVWPDGRGGFYLSDGANGVLRYVDARGVISTIAGSGRR